MHCETMKYPQKLPRPVKKKPNAVKTTAIAVLNRNVTAQCAH
jgi:hypothetical protein